MDELALYASTNTEIRSAFVKAKHPDFSNSDLAKATVGILSSISIPNSSSHYRISLYNEKGNFISIGIPYSKSYTTGKLASKNMNNGIKASLFLQTRHLYMDSMKIIGVKMTKSIFLYSEKFSELMHFFKAMVS